MLLKTCLIGFLALLIATSTTGQTLMLNDGEKGMAIVAGLGMTEGEMTPEFRAAYTLNNHVELGLGLVSIPQTHKLSHGYSTRVETELLPSLNLYTKPIHYDSTALVVGLHASYGLGSYSSRGDPYFVGASVTARMPTGQRSGVLVSTGYFLSGLEWGTGSNGYATIGLSFFGESGPTSRIGVTADIRLYEGPNTLFLGGVMNLGK